MRLLVFCMINSQLFPARHKRLKKKGTYRFRSLIKWQPTRIIVHCGLGAWQIWSSHISVCGLSRDEWIMQWYSWWRSGKLCMTVILATDFFFTTSLIPLSDVQRSYFNFVVILVELFFFVPFMTGITRGSQGRHTQSSFGHAALNWSSRSWRVRLYCYNGYR